VEELFRGSEWHYDTVGRGTRTLETRLARLTCRGVFLVDGLSSSLL
jgi:hypothetical protein